jgi:hypothetical protein
MTELALRAADVKHLSPPFQSERGLFLGGGKSHARSRRRELPTAGGKISPYPIQALPVGGTAVGGAMRRLGRFAHRSTPRWAVFSRSAKAKPPRFQGWLLLFLIPDMKGALAAMPRPIGMVTVSNITREWTCFSNKGRVPFMGRTACGSGQARLGVSGNAACKAPGVQQQGLFAFRCRKTGQIFVYKGEKRTENLKRVQKTHKEVDTMMKKSPLYMTTLMILVVASLFAFVGYSVFPSNGPVAAAAFFQEATPTPTPTPTPAPTLIIVKEVSPDLVNDLDGDGVIDPGDTIKYIITYENIGDAEATKVTIVDDYDQTLIDSIANISAEGRDDGDTIT